MKTKLTKSIIIASFALAMALAISCGLTGEVGNGNASEDSNSSSGTSLGGGAINNSSSSVAYSSSSFSSSSNIETTIVYGESVSYEGETYPTVVIGTQTWFAKNLNYAAEGSVCYSNEQSNCDKCGRLYDWSTVLTVCPSGWHLPSSTEWITLKNYVKDIKGCSCDAQHLKSTSGWNEDGNGLDSYGFEAMPCGLGKDGSFSGAGYSGLWWWKTSENGSDWSMMYNSDWGIFMANNDKTRLLSIRCLKD